MGDVAREADALRSDFDGRVDVEEFARLSSLAARIACD